MWQSPDPILADYLGGAPVGGVYAPANLSLYSYAHQRPLVAKDPDGELAWFVVIGVIMVADRLYTGYEIGRDVHDVATGERAAGEVIQSRGTEYAAGLALGTAGKWTVRGGKRVWVALRGADDIAEAGVRQVDEATDAARMTDELRTGDGPIHHVCTDKNCVSTARGGPWTPEFQPMFDKAGMSMQDVLNKVRVPGHKGPHPEVYHQTVFDRLQSATKGLDGNAYKQAFQKELAAIREEVASPGSFLNSLVVKD